MSSPSSDSESESSEEEEELDESQGSSTTSGGIPLLRLMASMSGPPSSGRWARSAFSQWTASWGRLFTVLGQTLGKLEIEQKFWVTAIVESRFITTCHQPEGTNITSPGACTAWMTGNWSLGHWGESTRR